MQENPQNPPNNKEEINIGFTLEDEANQDIKGNKKTNQLLRKLIIIIKLLSKILVLIYLL